MSYRIGKANNIMLTRGDTLKAMVNITDTVGEPYIPKEGDCIRFAMKKHYEDEKPLILRDIPIDTMILTLNPEDTKKLPFGEYVYDIELTTANGDVDTFISKANLLLTEEVH